MELFSYYDLTTKRGYDAAAGGTSVGIPTIVAGETMRLHSWFRENRGGSVAEALPNVRAMKATMGTVDKRPEEGNFKMDVDGEEFATAITFDPADVATFLTDMETALQALASITSVTITARNGSYIIIFEDDVTVEHTITIVDNRLHPASFIRVRTYQRGGRWEHEFRMVQSPVAYTSTFELEPGPIPEIGELRDGGGEDDSPVNEIQSLYIPQTFAGTFRVVKDGTIRSEPLSRKSSLEDIATAMEFLAEAGGIFILTSPIDSTVYIEFAGEMGGLGYDPLTIEIFQAPTESHTVVLDTKTREMADVMQGVDVTALIVEIHAEIEDPDDEDVYHWHAIYRQQVTVRESVDWDELATAPNIDWLQPPTHVSYNPFSPGQVANGQIHYDTTFGDGAATTFVVDHGLDITNLNVIVTENTTPGDCMVNGTDYTWERTTTDRITITWLGTTPTSAQYIVAVVGLELTSFFDAHTHLISEVTGLQDWMDTIEARLALLEANAGASAQVDLLNEDLEVARWTLPRYWELYPSRVQPTRPDTGMLIDVNVDEVGEDDRPIIGRAKGLLPAVHDATVEAMPVPIPVPSDTYNGKVYQNQTGDRLLVPGALGNRSTYVEDDEYLSCDGRLWYPVVQHRQYGSYDVTTDYATSTTLITFGNIALDELPPVGTVVQLTTTDTLPAIFSTGTDYYVVSLDPITGQVSLSATLAGDALIMADDGTGTHSIEVVAEISYYPEHFERTLFTMHINDNQLRYRKNFDLAFQLEAAVLKSNAEAQWNLVMEIGEARGVNSVGTEGDNLQEIVWRKIPALEQTIVLSPISTTHRFGCRIKRRLVEAADTLTMHNLIYGALGGAPVPPTGGNFSIRARLTCFDTDDNETDPRGFVMVSGFLMEPQGLPNRRPDEDETDFEYGYAVIS